MREIYDVHQINEPFTVGDCVVADDIERTVVHSEEDYPVEIPLGSSIHYKRY